MPQRVVKKLCILGASGGLPRKVIPQILIQLNAYVISTNYMNQGRYLQLSLPRAF